MGPLLLSVAQTLGVFSATPGGSGTPGLVIDFTNLAWWQTLVGIIGLLGLSPAPWLLGVATGRIQFSKPAEAAFNRERAALKEQFDARVAELTAHYEREMKSLGEHHDALESVQAERYSELEESRNGYRLATKEERARADRATDALGEMKDAIVAVGHAFTEFNQAAREVSADGSP